MMGLAVNIFLEWGEREMTGEIKFVAGSTKKELQEQLAIVTSQLVRKMDEIGGPAMVKVGFYLEIFDVPPPLEAMYSFQHAFLKEGQLPKIAWSEIKSRIACAKKGDSNGKA